jgi:RRXRR protein
MEQSIVYIQSITGKPLMPTKRRNKVWYWLRKGLAKVISREPFTIQLCFETANYTQPVTVGVDTGSKCVGIAATTDGEVSSLKNRVVSSLQSLFGEGQVSITYGYETKYKRIQVLDLPKSHVNDAVAIACEIGETVKPLEVVHLIRCLPRGQYQRFNGLHSEHKCWAPRKVRGFKLYELVEAKGKVGYIAGRREKGAFVIKDVVSGKKLLEVTPRKLGRVVRPTRGWMITRQLVPDSIRQEGGASSPS